MTRHGGFEWWSYSWPRIKIKKEKTIFFLPKSKESHVIMVWGMEAVEEVKGGVAVS